MELIAHPDVLERMSDAMRTVAKPDAADKIADELVALAAAHR
jgi:UDP-N-acetylglucosamine:LPS N-acetylglucosamine transferase